MKTNISCNKLTLKKSFNGRYSSFFGAAKKPGDLRNLRHRSKERKKKKEERERERERETETERERERERETKRNEARKRETKKPSRFHQTIPQ